MCVMRHGESAAAPLVLREKGQGADLPFLRRAVVRTEAEWQRKDFAVLLTRMQTRISSCA